MTSETVKNTGYIVSGSVAAYVLDQVMQMVDPSAPTLTGLLKPSNITKLIGGIIVPIYAAYGKQKSARARLVEAGVAAYYIPQVIQLARSMVSAPMRFSKVIPSGLGMPQPMMMPAASSSYRARIF
jgi:hypothetical protein